MLLARAMTTWTLKLAGPGTHEDTNRPSKRSSPVCRATRDPRAVLAAAGICAGARHLLDLRIEPLDRLIRYYRSITAALDGASPSDRAAPSEDTLPQFNGFQTIERLQVAGSMGGSSSSGDLALNLIVVAGEERRRDPSAPAASASSCRKHARWPSLIADRSASSSSSAMRTRRSSSWSTSTGSSDRTDRAVARIRTAPRCSRSASRFEHAHALGLQHRDLKPSNIMVDAQLVPRILDFGLSDGNPVAATCEARSATSPRNSSTRRSRSTGARMFTHWASSVRAPLRRAPSDGTRDDAMISAIQGEAAAAESRSIRACRNRCRHIALKAMERDPVKRYASALDMASICAILDGRPVQARPRVYASTLGMRSRRRLAGR